MFAELGSRCVAPDMRGYGRSSVYGQHADYAVKNSVHDMIKRLSYWIRWGERRPYGFTTAAAQ